MDKAMRKQLKEQCRSSRPTMGVVTILNSQNNRIYIEGAINLEALSNKIRFMLSSGQCDNIALQHDWDKMGDGSFEFQYVQIIPYEKDKIVDYRKIVLEAENGIKTKLAESLDFY